MELWIRSQDRMNLVQIKQISLNYQNNKQVIANYEPEQYENSGCFYELLGTYETKERAMQILDEIQELLQAETVKTETKHINDIEYEKTVTIIPNIPKNTIIYEMPEK